MPDRLKNVKRIQIIISVSAIIIVMAHLIWPSLQIDSTTLFLIAIAVIPWLIPLFKSLEFPGGWKVEFQEQEYLDIKEEAIEQAASASQIKINWDMVATLFWLGNDLMWIQDMIYRAASPERILLGVTLAMQYANDLGFDEKSLPIRNLSLSKVILESLVGFIPANEQNRSVLEGHYGTVQQYIQGVKWYIDALAKIQQPDFKKLRAY
ncbi:MAG: hypothetical protein HOD49_00095 [Anaerolineae bacterium]|jgi:hypothetical protein|nr:hypothetical protein [Anaerolineae bacterium]